VLEVGCGHGAVTAELRRRAAGEVVALDTSPSPGAAQVAALAEALPFRDSCFDLIFFQNVLLWVPRLAAALGEAARVLQPGGDLVAIEPDYGGMIEHPDLDLAALWQEGLSRAGADPRVGRKLPAVCEAAGLRVWVELAHLPRPAQPETVALLEGLPLTEQECATAAAARHALENKPGDWGVFVHVPYFLVVAGKP
jgi:SAM-dependent methyltransferase